MYLEYIGYPDGDQRSGYQYDVSHFRYEHLWLLSMFSAYREISGRVPFRDLKKYVGQWVCKIITESYIISQR